METRPKLVSKYDQAGRKTHQPSSLGASLWLVEWSMDLDFQRSAATSSIIILLMSNCTLHAPLIWVPSSASSLVMDPTNQSLAFQNAFKFHHCWVVSICRHTHAQAHQHFQQGLSCCIFHQLWKRKLCFPVFLDIDNKRSTNYCLVWMKWGHSFSQDGGLKIKPHLMKNSNFGPPFDCKTGVDCCAFK